MTWVLFAWSVLGLVASPVVGTRAAVSASSPWRWCWWPTAWSRPGGCRGPDLAVHLGDLADGSVVRRGHQVDSLGDVRAPRGTASSATTSTAGAPPGGSSTCAASAGRPFHFLVRTQQPALAGLSRHGGTQLYVSRGTGFWGPPLRIFAPSEITVLTSGLRAGPPGWG